MSEKQSGDKSGQGAPSDPVRRALSKRAQIAPFIVMDVMAKANLCEARGEDIIHMEVGQPATAAPQKALERAQDALQNERLGYTDALGLPELREGIADHYQTFYGISVPPERILITTGSSAAFVLAFLALFDQGAKIALPRPGYPCYRHILSSLGNEAVPIATGAEGRWMITAEDLEREKTAHNLQGLILASPANPTGTMLLEGPFETLIKASERLGLWFISDEIYHGLSYAEPAQTALSYSENAIVINSFSKYFSMTGWRLGWMVVPLELIRTFERLIQNLYISAPALSQFAALGALQSSDELEAHKAVYAQNRALLLDALPSIGFDKILPADGAFYLYADVQNLTENSVDFARTMLQEIGVATTPGLDFDEEYGARFLRFSYAGETGKIAEAVRRLKVWLK